MATVADIESAVSAEISQTQGIVDNVTGQIEDLLAKLNSLSSTMFIPTAPNLSDLSYPGDTESKIKSGFGVPDIPSSISSPPQADTSLTYLASDYERKIDVSKLDLEKNKFISAATSGMINPSSIKVSFLYQDPLAPALSGDGGSPIIMIIKGTVLAGMSGYLVLDDLWAADSFAIGQERDAIELERASVKAQNKWSGLGYDGAPGMLAGEITDAHQLYLDNKLKQSQGLGIKQYDASFAFRQAMLAAATSIAGTALSHANGVQNRALDAAKSVVRFAIDQYNLLVSRWANKVEIAKLPVDVAVENLKLSVEKEGLAASDSVETYKLRAYKFAIDTQKYKNDLTFYRETLRQFSQTLGLAETNDRVVLMNDSITLKEAEVSARISLQLARMALQSFAETMSSQIHAIAAGGKVYSNAISSANNAIATLVTLDNFGDQTTAT
jgi:hypothetical protein